MITYSVPDLFLRAAQLKEQAADGQDRHSKEFTLGLASRSPYSKRQRRTGCVFLE